MDLKEREKSELKKLEYFENTSINWFVSLSTDTFLLGPFTPDRGCLLGSLENSAGLEENSV